jgi:hypothetical protein
MLAAQKAYNTILHCFECIAGINICNAKTYFDIALAASESNPPYGNYSTAGIFAQGKACRGIKHVAMPDVTLFCSLNQCLRHKSLLPRFSFLS